jgi:hypothetical protein
VLLDDLILRTQLRDFRNAEPRDFRTAEVSKGKRRLEARILFKFHTVLYAAGTFQTSPNTTRISSQEVVIVLGEQCFMVCLSLGRMMAFNEQIINFSHWPKTTKSI